MHLNLPQGLVEQTNEEKLRRSQEESQRKQRVEDWQDKKQRREAAAPVAVLALYFELCIN